MPGQLLAQANPPPDPSGLADDILNYAVQLNIKDFLSENEHKSVQLFTRAANYIAAGMQPRAPFPASHSMLL